MSNPGFGKESGPIRRPDALPSFGPPPSLQPLRGPPPPMLNPAPTPTPYISPPKSITSQIPTLTIWELENIVEARDISMTQAVGLIRDWLSRQRLKFEKLFLCGCIKHAGLQGRMEEVERIDRVICNPILKKDGGEEADITIVMEIVKFVLQHPICAVILITTH
ncbi:hypothetical protein MLD38_036045 [Melastoma candidum]|uniref:Uncharacterized protein n=1 Tax=Melastoma candidum TaxID=119954 RepID=A0ACB9LHZ3_9MYRT|nr:hypothetical protein MLD38_036045 [Melastoma candidum]